MTIQPQLTKSETANYHKPMNYYQETRQRVSAKDAAARYGVEINRYGKARCIFHTEKTASLSFKGGRFKCFGCGASGDSIDLVSRLFGLEPLEALKKVNRDFSLSLPLDRDPTPEECQADLRRRELDQAHREFESWRIRTIDQLNAAYRVGHEALKTVTDLDKLTEAETEAIRFMAWAEYLTDTLSFGTAAEQMQVFRGRRGVELRTQKILSNTQRKSGVA